MDVLHLFLHSGVNGDWVVPIDYYAATMNIYIQFFCMNTGFLFLPGKYLEMKMLDH